MPMINPEQFADYRAWLEKVASTNEGMTHGLLLVFSVGKDEIVTNSQVISSFGRSPELIREAVEILYSTVETGTHTEHEEEKPQ